MTALLEGLEATVARSSSLERTKRIDAEYFRCDFLASEALLKSKPHDHVAALAKVSDGNHFTISEDFVEKGVPYYRGQDVVGQFFIENATPNYITEEAYNRTYMRRSHLRKGDVLLSIVGTIGELSLVGADTPATCSCKLAILRPNAIRSELLATFLRSRHGRNQIKRLTRGAVQQGIILEDMDQLWVPKLSKDLENAVVQAVNSASNLRQKASRLTRQAESELFSALGLADWTPSEPLTYVKRLSNTFFERRLDAQFHRPKYDKLRSLLEDRFDIITLEGLVQKGRTVPYSDGGEIPIIRSGDLSDIEDEEKFLRAEASEPIFYLNFGDVLISSIGFGSIGKVQVYDKISKHGTVSEVTVIRQQRLNPYYLAAYLRSPLGQLQIDRYITGATGQLHLYPRDVEKIFVPVLPNEQQENFEKIYREARQTITNSKSLLDSAQRAVEIAIERSEQAALVFLAEHKDVA